MEDVNVLLLRKEITKLDMGVKASIQDILHCDGPSTLLQSLNDDVRMKMNSLRQKIEQMASLGKEQEKETDCQIILKEVSSHKSQLQVAQAALRRANLTCQLSIERREKDELFSTQTDVRQRSAAGKEDVVKTAGTITDNLVNLSKMMSAQVERGGNTVNTLINSSSKLTENQDEFKSMKGHIQNSRKLLSKYARRDLSDKILIFFAAVFFFATVLYIVKKRFFFS